MPCYHPLTAYRAAGGGITFNEGGDAGAALELPCGRCIGCKIKRNLEWTTRCMHEAQMHRNNCFITLTYGDSETNPSLNYADFKKFTRRLRASDQSPIRYFVAGEYGSENKRPHWHALLFGKNFRDQQPIGKLLNRSPELEQLWPHGFSSIGELNWTTAAYVTSYCISKITGEPAEKHYTRVHLATGELIRVEPEMARMSLRPAIGKTWFEKYWKEVYETRDAVTKQGGKTVRPPRYYDKLMATHNIRTYRRMREIENERGKQAIERQADNTKERLEVRETVTKAKIKQKQRKL